MKNSTKRPTSYDCGKTYWSDGSVTQLTVQDCDKYQISGVTNGPKS